MILYYTKDSVFSLSTNYPLKIVPESALSNSGKAENPLIEAVTEYEIRKLHENNNFYIASFCVDLESTRQ